MTTIPRTHITNSGYRQVNYVVQCTVLLSVNCLKVSSSTSTREEEEEEEEEEEHKW